MSDPVILAGDVGGTKTVLALFGVEGGRLVQGRTESLPSSDHSGLVEAIDAFLPPPHVDLRAAGFGVAGPVWDGRVKTTNLPWEVDEAALQKHLGVERALVLNDLEATAWGIELLQADEFLILQEGTPYHKGNAALIAAGTGLGQALMFRHEGRLIPGACEGGHTDFAPDDEEADALLYWLRRELHHVSMERVVSGMGLALIYKFFHRSQISDDPPHHDGGDDEDRARLLAGSASARSCAACTRGMALFMRCYGAEAGNLALKGGATAGIYVGGGIAAKNLEAMQSGIFLRAFHAKGRYTGYMEKIPVRIILNQTAPLLGAALAAARSTGLVD